MHALLWLLSAVVVAWVCCVKWINRKIFDLKGRCVVITGAGQGLGRSIAVQFAIQGANVVLVDIREDFLQQAEQFISQTVAPAGACRVLTVVCDVASESSVQRAAELIRVKMGSVDVVVNNAGTAALQSVLSARHDEFLKTFRVNTHALFFVARAFVPEMIRQKHGHLVTVGSVMDLVPAGCPLTF